MSMALGTFTPGDRFRDADEQLAEIRQTVLDGMKRAIDDAKSAWLFPNLLVEAIENEIWKYPRKTDYYVAEPMPLQEFIKAPYPRGLGATADLIEKLIAGNEKAMLAWDAAFRGKHGGDRGLGRDPETGRLLPKGDSLKLDDIQLEAYGKQAKAPTGTSSQAGLRRLEKAAGAGDGNAADMLRRVLDPNDPMTVNGACVHMGWRQPTKTVVDTDDGMADAVVRKLGPLDSLRQIWKRANTQQREEIAAWVDEQMSPVRNSRFG